MSLRQSNNYVWSIADLVGQGATGNVFMCRNKKDGKPFAAKVFNHMGQMRASEIRLRETALLRKLKHENVVTLVAEESEMGTRATVLIMELCDTSLYHILELPENYYGLSEDEFKRVLLDVACGMKFLKEHNVVHRDVKPGNILRMRSSTGGSIYKLTDFGAARQLKDADQSFMSIYGTEEYLHPDVYEKAVMKNFSKKKFTAAVDLWSMGVTFYHAATGQLPFRPYGGRQNKETMFEIISKKGPKVISGVQKSNGGPIDYDSDLPEETRISKGLKLLLRPVLQELLETSGEGLANLFTFDQFHRQVEDIVSRKVADVFYMCSSTWHKIYLKMNDEYEQLSSSIIQQADISIDNQQLFVSCEEFKPRPNSLAVDFPRMTRENPLLVIGGGAIPQTQLYQRKIANLPKIPSGKTRPDSDIDILKIYSSVCFAYQFSAEDLQFCSMATAKAFDTLMSLLKKKLQMVWLKCQQLERFKDFMENMIFRANKELNDLKVNGDLKYNGTHNNSHMNTPSENQMSQEGILQVDGFQDLRILLQRASFICGKAAVPVQENHCLEDTAKWLDEIKTMVDDVNGIFTHIAKDKSTGVGILEDLIHTAKKQQITDCMNTITEKYERLAAVRRDFHVKFYDWFRCMNGRLSELSNIDKALETVDVDKLQMAVFQAMGQISAEKTALLRSQNEKPDTGLCTIEKEVSSLENILQDILVLVEEGDQKLMSSKEIFEDLSTCDS